MQALWYKRVITLQSTATTPNPSPSKELGVVNTLLSQFLRQPAPPHRPAESSWRCGGGDRALGPNGHTNDDQCSIIHVLLMAHVFMTGRDSRITYFVSCFIDTSCFSIRSVLYHLHCMVLRYLLPQMPVVVLWPPRIVLFSFVAVMHALFSRLLLLCSTIIG